MLESMKHMGDDDKLLAWRRGWTWTLLKCAAVTATFSGLTYGALYWLLWTLLEYLPDWFPSTWAQWMFQWLLSKLWIVSPVVGLTTGFFLSLGIVAMDAKRGRLTKL